MKQLIFIGFLIALSACNNIDDLNEVTDIDHAIEYGRFGGFCGELENIYIAGDTVKYVFEQLCNESQNKSSSRALTDAEIRDIHNTFDATKIQSLNWESCNRCADGIDYYLEIVNDSSKKRLEFSTPESIDDMHTFINTLQNILKSFQ